MNKRMINRFKIRMWYCGCKFIRYLWIEVDLFNFKIFSFSKYVVYDGY